MHGWRSVVEDLGKESIDESEISIHSSRTSGYVYFKWKNFVCVHRKDFNPVGHCLLCAFLRLNVLLKHFIRKVQGNILNQDQFQPSGRKTLAIISERDRRMVSEYLFAVCVNIICTVRYTFPHTAKRYFARLSCAYTCISPNRFQLNSIIYASSHELFSVSSPSRLCDTQKLFSFNLVRCTR